MARSFSSAAILLLASCLANPLTFAQSSSDEALELMQAEEDAFQSAVQKVQDTIVQIETFGGMQLVDNAAVAEGPSTGTIVGEEGWIITSKFQFRNSPASITVVLSDGTRKAARVVAQDHSRELVLLKIDVDKPLPTPAAVNRSELQVGQWAIALGKTFDAKVASRSVGIVSAINRIWNKAVQSDAKISPMNYGGPLIDIEGRVIGILAPIDPGIATEGEVQQWYDSGIGFAIPLEDILQRLAFMQEGKDIQRGLLGFRPKGRDDFDKTVTIAGVLPGTPLADAGFREGDIIRKINDQEVLYVNHLRHLLGPVDAGQTARVTVERDGQAITKECKLVAELPTYRSSHIGLIPRLDVETKRIIVDAIETDGPADKAGIKAGEIIVKIGDEPINSMNDFVAKLDFSDYRRPILLQVVAPDQSEPRVLEVPIKQWPTSSELDLPNLELLGGGVKAEEGVAAKATGLVDLPFSDLPNKVFAYVPSEPARAPLGLFLLAAEPGIEPDRQAVVDAWQTFCRDQNFAICVITSGDPSAWSIEELEVFDRALAHMEENYKIDERLTVVGGFGAGGTIAMVTAFERSEKVRSLVFGTDRVPQSSRIPAVEPQNGIDILFGPESEKIAEFQEALLKKGYRTESLKSDYKIDEDGASKAGEHLRRYVATLRWY